MYYCSCIGQILPIFEHQIKVNPYHASTVTCTCSPHNVKNREHCKNWEMKYEKKASVGLNFIPPLQLKPTLFFYVCLASKYTNFSLEFLQDSFPSHMSTTRWQSGSFSEEMNHRLKSMVGTELGFFFFGFYCFLLPQKTFIPFKTSVQWFCPWMS